MEGANVETVKSTKGKDKIYVGGYLYVLDKKLSGGGLAYECEKRRSYGDRAGQCHGRLHAKDGKVTKVIREHTHAPEPGRVDALKAAVRIKQKAMDTQNTAQQIITEELQSLSQGIANYNCVLFNTPFNVNICKKL